MKQNWSSWKRSLFVLIFLIDFACSSAPARIDGINDRKEKAFDYLKFGQNYFQQGSYQKSLEFFLIALDYFTAVDFHQGMASAYNSIASAYLATNKIQEARKALEEAKQLEENLDDNALKLQTLNGQVEVDLAENNNDQALERLTQADPQTFPQTKEGSMLFHALGVVYKNKGHSDLAMRYFHQAIRINAGLNLKQELASNYFMIASLHSKLGQSEQAEASLYQALTLDREMENTVGIGQDYRALGIILEKKGLQEKAYAMLIRSNRVFQAGGILFQQLKTLELLIPLAQKLGKTKDKTYFENLQASTKEKLRR